MGPTLQRLSRVTPAAAQRNAKAIRNRVQAARHRGNAVSCPVCGGTFALFLPRGGRPGAACPGCYSVERHRMFWLFFQRRTDLLTAPLRVLHLAPEDQLERRFRAQPNLDYVTGDLNRRDVDSRVDVTQMSFPDASFDVVICSHVLEHVDDDIAAMRELRRVIRPGGWALLTAPVDDARTTTFEDWTVTDPRGRHEVFGQWDHVRIYGRDFPDLLHDQGWEVEVTPLPLTAEESRTYGIPESEQRIYLCTPA